MKNFRALIGTALALSLGAGIAVTAGAQQPVTTVTAATPAPPPGPSPETIKKATDAGLKPEVHRGVTMFCWEDANVGTRFKTKKCVGALELDGVIEQREADREQMNRGGGIHP